MNNFLAEYDDVIKAYQKVNESVNNKTVKGISFTREPNDVNGNPIYSVELKVFLKSDEKYPDLSMDELVNRASDRAKTIGFKKFQTGNVTKFKTSSYELQNDADAIIKLMGKDVSEADDDESDELNRPDATAEKEINKVKELFRSIKDGNIDAVKRAIQDDGIGVNTKDSGDKTLLIAAVIANKIDIVKFLIGSGANVNRTSGGSTALDFAKSDDMKKLLRDNGAKNGKESRLDKEYKDSPELDVELDSTTLNIKLIEAVKTNSISGVKNFVKQGATINYMNPKDKDRTAMFYAYTPEMVNVLNELGWDVNAFDIDGNEPIHVVCVNPGVTPETIITFAKLGADVDSQNDKKETPRILVKKPEIWQALKDESEFKDEFNLINSVKGNKKFIVSYLLKNGESPMMRDKRGVTAYQIAKNLGFKDIVELMDKYIKDT